MTKGIDSRYEFMYFIECKDGNPNGDPDAANAPRIDPENLQGLISDVAVKRRVRNYIEVAESNATPYAIYIEHMTNLNKQIALAYEKTSSLAKAGKGRELVLARNWLCDNFFDIRTFGAVLSTGANAGQVRGPVQLMFARSVDPILPMDMSITRVAKSVELNVKAKARGEKMDVVLEVEQADESMDEAITNDKKDMPASYAQYETWENNQLQSKLRGMGRKSIIPYGLFVGKGFISANLAQLDYESNHPSGTGFDEKDLDLLWESLLGMYEHDRSANKGHMSTMQPLIIFRHVGTDSDENQRKRQMRLGCTSAHRLFDLVNIKRISQTPARDISDYELTIQRDRLPKGVELGLAITGEGGKPEILWKEHEKLCNDFAWLKIQ